MPQINHVLLDDVSRSASGANQREASFVSLVPVLTAKQGYYSISKISLNYQDVANGLRACGLMLVLMLKPSADDGIEDDLIADRSVIAVLV